jgi:hypothetical protein
MAPVTAMVQVRIPEAFMVGLEIIAGAGRMVRGNANNKSWKGMR